MVDKLNNFYTGIRAGVLYYWNLLAYIWGDNCSIKVLKGIKEDELMNAAEKKELENRIKGMSEEELRVVLDNIPVDLCLDRVATELDRLYTLETNLAGLVKKMEG